MPVGVAIVSPMQMYKVLFIRVIYSRLLSFQTYREIALDISGKSTIQS
jgi:hypothetical protein